MWKSKLEVDVYMPRGVTALVTALPVTRASERRGLFRWRLQRMWARWTRRDESGDAPSAQLKYAG